MFDDEQYGIKTLPRLQSYAERPDEQDTKFDKWGRKVSGVFNAKFSSLRAIRLKRILKHVRRHEQRLAEKDDASLRRLVQELRVSLQQAVAQPEASIACVGETFALVREVSSRTLGLKHYDVQVLGAWSMLKGQIAEMRTGEGKTLCATLAASTMALAGRPVHVITVNDYLAQRDAELMKPLYDFLGLSVGVILEGQQYEERHEIYKCDIVHGSNKEIAFDYLRDRMELRKRPGNLRRKIECLSQGDLAPELRMRGLHFAIIDEADSVLIDEARTPLVISGQVADTGLVDAAMLRTAMTVAEQLEEGLHYKIHHNESRIEITEDGEIFLESVGERSTGAFRVAAIRDHAVMQALTAVHLFHRDAAYIVRDDKVQIVDENTGRVMEDRSWSEGLHQLVEIKEDLELTEPRETLGRITYQRFFRRYETLAGMTGTAQDAAWELWFVYGLAIARIPTNRPDARRFRSDRVFGSEEKKLSAIAKQVSDLNKKGVPILLGTRTVSTSEKISKRLSEIGINHQVLSAAQDADEARIVERAGQRGTVTVATNMAGRGTDIKLGSGVTELGGLHVLLSERHDSRRVDRQLEGRCGRQGDPGIVQAFLSLDDDLMRPKSARLHRWVARSTLVFLPAVARLMIRWRQKTIENVHGRMRHDLLDADSNLGKLLAFSGRLE